MNVRCKNPALEFGKCLLNSALGFTQHTIENKLYYKINN